VLKFHSVPGANVGMGGQNIPGKSSYSPFIPLENLMIRDVATGNLIKIIDFEFNHLSVFQICFSSEKTAIYLISMTKMKSQIYELIAPSFADKTQ